MCDDYCTTVDATYDIDHIMVFLELLERPRALDEAPLAVAELTELIVTPEEKGPVLETTQSVAAAAAQVIDMQGFPVGVRAIVDFRDIRDQGEVVKMRSTVDAQLTPKVLSTAIH